jgi:hypothetical protein
MTSVLRSRSPRSDARGEASSGRDHEPKRRSDSRRSGDSQNVKSSHIIAEQIDVGVARKTAYDQWTQYGKWSEMFKAESGKPGSNGSGRRRGSQADEQVVTASSKIGPSRRQWEAEIVEVVPSRRIAWRAKGGAGAEVAEQGLRDRYLSVLTEGIQNCRYPSVTMMDRMERSITDRESAEHYVEVLLDSVSQDQYPSPMMLDRIAGLLAVLEP